MSFADELPQLAQVLPCQSCDHIIGVLSQCPEVFTTIEQDVVEGAIALASNLHVHKCLRQVSRTDFTLSKVAQY